MKTGQKCTVTGMYYCQDHPEYVINIQAEDIFPPCNYNGNSHGTTWQLV